MTWVVHPVLAQSRPEIELALRESTRGMEAEGGSSQELFMRRGIGVLVAAIQTVEGQLHESGEEELERKWRKTGDDERWGLCMDWLTRALTC